MILDDIFRGSFSMEELTYPTTPEYKQMSSQISDQLDKVKSVIGEENKPLIEDLLNRIYSLQLMETEACFKAGFAIGMEVQRECSQQLEIFNHNNDY